MSSSTLIHREEHLEHCCEDLGQMSIAYNTLYAEKENSVNVTTRS